MANGQRTRRSPAPPIELEVVAVGIERPVANAKQSTVAVISRTFDLKTGEPRKPVAGSGVVIADGLVVTCAHVLRYEPTEVTWKGLREECRSENGHRSRLDR